MKKGHDRAPFLTWCGKGTAGCWVGGERTSRQALWDCGVPIAYWVRVPHPRGKSVSPWPPAEINAIRPGTSSRRFSSARSPHITATNYMAAPTGSASGCSTPSSCPSRAKPFATPTICPRTRGPPGFRRADAAARRGLPRHRPRRAPAPVRGQVREAPGARPAAGSAEAGLRTRGSTNTAYGRTDRCIPRSGSTSARSKRTVRWPCPAGSTSRTTRSARSPVMSGGRWNGSARSASCDRSGARPDRSESTTRTISRRRNGRPKAYGVGRRGAAVRDTAVDRDRAGAAGGRCRGRPRSEARYHEFTQQLWRCGVSHLDFSILNIGIAGSGPTERLQIFDPHMGVIDVADGAREVQDPVSVHPSWERP